VLLGHEWHGVPEDQALAADACIEIPRHHACAVRPGIETDMNGGDGHGPSSDQ
jgi:hypothetical protein